MHPLPMQKDNLDAMEYSTLRLTEIFLANLSAKYTGDIPSEGIFEKILQEVLSDAQKRWPDFDLSEEYFIAYLAQRLSGKRSPLEEIENTHTADVYLCAACLQGDRAAQQALMELAAKLVKSSLLNFGTTEISADEVQQQVLERLTAPGVEHKPRLALYNGSSRLVSWLKIIVVRTILDMKKSLQCAGKHDDGLLMALMSNDNQELAYFKSLYKAEFKKAFHQALSKLSDQEKNLLCYQLLDGLTLEKISEILHVNRSTICRRLQQVRDKLQVHTRRAMMEHLQIDGDEFESILGLIASRLDASFCGILKEDSPAN